MKFITFGNSMTMGDAQPGSTKTVAVKAIMPEIIGSIGLGAVGAALMLWGVVSGVRGKKTSVLNLKTLGGAGVLVASRVMAHNAADRYETDVTPRPLALKPLTLKPHT